MATASEKSIRAALSNIVHFGDTDVFPFPLEKYWFATDLDEVVKLLQACDQNFHSLVGDYPLTFVKSLDAFSRPWKAHLRQTCTA
jgi:hypothetical protein